MFSEKFYSNHSTIQTQPVASFQKIEQTEVKTTQSLEDAIFNEFMGSGISKEVFPLNVRLVHDVEFDPITNQVTATPLDDLLGSDFVRFGHNPNNAIAAVFTQETGEDWQYKIFGRKKPKQKIDDGKSGFYMAPKGIGDTPYFPSIPQETINAIAAKYNLNPPENGSFWEWFKENK